MKDNMFILAVLTMGLLCFIGWLASFMSISICIEKGLPYGWISFFVPIFSTLFCIDFVINSKLNREMFFVRLIPVRLKKFWLKHSTTIAMIGGISVFLLITYIIVHIMIVVNEGLKTL